MHAMGCFLFLFRIMLCCLQYNYYYYLLFFHFPILSVSSSSPLHSTTQPFLCHPDQSSALLQFRDSFEVNIDDAPWDCQSHFHNITTWENGTDCCSWDGVTCDSMSGHVIGLDLSCSGIEGQFHPNSTLFHLTHLRRLNLALNGFFSSKLPSQIGGFASLTHLNLSFSLFEGDIPSQISHLSKLVSLDLSQSFNNGLQWKGTTWKRLLQNATSLKEILLDYTNMSSISLSSLSYSSSSLVTLRLAYTGIEGDLTSDSILCLPNLQELSLKGNSDIQVHLPDKLNCSASLTVLDLSGCSFQGSVPSSFANLTHLTSLILSHNEFNTSPIPSLLSNLQYLTRLDLSYNELTSVPSSLSNLSHLTHLDLSYNKLSGPIPSSLSNLQNLTYLDLSNNQLSGQIPDALISGLTKLQTLKLCCNNLGGKLPSSLFGLTQLSSLDCSSNNFEGPLPNKISGFSSLTELQLSNNQLNETIPSWCLSLPSLTSLDLANNQFIGHIGAISSSSLQVLHLCGNKLQGGIHESIFNLADLTSLCLSSDNRCSTHFHLPLFSNLQNLDFLSLSGYSSSSLKSEINSSHTFPNLKSLILSNNKLQGQVPRWICDIGSLNFLTLSDNLLTSICLPSWNQLYSLDLSSNLLTGDIPSFICDATSLSYINLSQNKLTGTLPQCLTNFPSLEVLDLHMNRIHGTLPNTFSMNNALITLNLNGNQLQGPLPESLSNCTELEYLNLGNNQIEDTFPHWLENLQDLEVLVLRANKFYGPIVSMIEKQSFSNLIFFDISCNNFSGPLPEDYIKKFQMMKNVGAGSKTYSEYMVTIFGIASDSDIRTEYDNSLIATVKGVNTNLTKIPMVFVNIDLSVNSFEGEIPNVIGELQGFIGLNLSHNRFTGPIPHSMGNLTNLESLDLSSNMLTGGIPIELTYLTFLEVLNLSHNQLVGPIPKGKQFDTFSNESYEGNIGLCGLPLSAQCNKDPESPSSPTSDMEEKFGFGWKPVAIGYGCGMVFGIGLGCLVLFIGKPIWLVSMFGGVPNNKRVRRRRRGTRTHGNRARVK